MSISVEVEDHFERVLYSFIKSKSVGDQRFWELVIRVAHLVAMTGKRIKMRIDSPEIQVIVAIDPDVKTVEGIYVKVNQAGPYRLTEMMKDSIELNQLSKLSEFEYLFLEGEELELPDNFGERESADHTDWAIESPGIESTDGASVGGAEPFLGND